jgi:uncharacterized protein YggU (UPF0235/DUF167 family)
MRINVRVIPRSSRIEVVWEGEVLKVRLPAAPVDGAANEALIKLLAARLDLPRSALRIIQGAGGRQKVLEIEGLTKAEVIKKLA